MSRTVFYAVLFCIFSTLFFTGMQQAGAAGQRPVVAVLPVIDNSSQRCARFALEVIQEDLGEKFGNGRYIVLSGQALEDGLRREGIDDARDADPAEVYAALQRMRVDYCVRTELLYVTLSQKASFPTVLMLVKTWTATVPLSVNIIDLNQGYSIYNSTIVETGKHDAIIGFANQSHAVRAALDKVLDRLNREAYIPE